MFKVFVILALLVLAFIVMLKDSDLPAIVHLSTLVMFTKPPLSPLVFIAVPKVLIVTAFAKPEKYTPIRKRLNSNVENKIIFPLLSIMICLLLFNNNKFN